MKGKVWLVLLGFVLGVVLTLFVPRLIGPYLPSGLSPRPPTSDSTVEAKQWQDDRLLVTLVTGEGATLATFSQKVAEIDLLIDVGDLVALGTLHYEPFVNDPPIVKVVKKEQQGSEMATGPIEATVEPVPDEESVEEAPVDGLGNEAETTREEPNPPSSGS